MNRALVLAALAAVSCAHEQEVQPTAAPREHATADAMPAVPAAAVALPSGPQVAVTLYVMSQCPYGVQAEDAFQLAVDKLGPRLRLEVDYIGQQGPHGLSSLHGPDEVAGDIAQLCARAHSDRWFQLILCQNRDRHAIGHNWQDCAWQLDLPVDAIRRCIEGGQGRTLLRASFERAEQAGARGSPTIVIAGQPYEGRRGPKDFLRKICAAYPGDAPAACEQLPAPAEVRVTVLGDQRCDKCDPQQLQALISTRVAKPVFTAVDYSSAEGKALYAAIKPAALPAALFDASLAGDSDAVADLGRFLHTAGERRFVSYGDWNPECADDGGCKLDACKDKLICRAEKAATLEVGIMSQCPFAVKGINAMRDVLDHFKDSKDRIDFSIHYIGEGDAKDGLSSLHGPAEVDEDMRELCAIQRYRLPKALDYIWCRNKDVRGGHWQDCSGKATGIDEKALDKCASGPDGKKLLEASFKLSAGIGLNASPTWIANGRHEFSGIDAEAILREFCRFNGKLHGCKAPLPSPAAAPAPAPSQPGCGR